MSLRGTGGSLTPQHQVGGTPLVSPKVNTKGQQLAQALGVAFQTASTAGVGLLNEMNAEGVQKALADGQLGEEFKDEKGLFNQWQKRKDAYDVGRSEYNIVEAKKAVSKIEPELRSQVLNGEISGAEYVQQLSQSMNSAELGHIDSDKYRDKWDKFNKQFNDEIELEGFKLQAERDKTVQTTEQLAVLDTELSDGIPMFELLKNPVTRDQALLDLENASPEQRKAYEDLTRKNTRAFVQKFVERMVNTTSMTKTEAQELAFSHVYNTAYMTNQPAMLEYVNEAGTDGFKPITVKSIANAYVGKRFDIVRNTQYLTNNAEREIQRQEKKQAQDTLYSTNKGISEIGFKIAELEQSIIGAEGIELATFTAQREALLQEAVTLSESLDELRDNEHVRPRDIDTMQNILRKMGSQNSANPKLSNQITKQFISRFGTINSTFAGGEGDRHHANLNDFINQAVEADLLIPSDLSKVISLVSSFGGVKTYDIAQGIQYTDEDRARMLLGSLGLKGEEYSTTFSMIENVPEINAVYEEGVAEFAQFINENGTFSNNPSDPRFNQKYREIVSRIQSKANSYKPTVTITEQKVLDAQGESQGANTLGSAFNRMAEKIRTANSSEPLNWYGDSKEMNLIKNTIGNIDQIDKKHEVLEDAFGFKSKYVRDNIIALQETERMNMELQVRNAVLDEALTNGSLVDGILGGAENFLIVDSLFNYIEKIDRIGRESGERSPIVNKIAEKLQPLFEANSEAERDVASSIGVGM